MEAAEKTGIEIGQDFRPGASKETSLTAKFALKARAIVAWGIAPGYLPEKRLRAEGPR
jgi:hypothetical protein